jgi:hypothetical protein
VPSAREMLTLRRCARLQTHVLLHHVDEHDRGIRGSLEEAIAFKQGCRSRADARGADGQFLEAQPVRRGLGGDKALASALDQ